MRSLRHPLLVLAFVGTVVAVPALAQQPSNYPAPCDASKVSKADVDRAHSVFLSGKQFLDESNYDKAIGYFNDAYSIDCSVHAILPIIATAYERKGDKGEAVRALDEYLRRVPNAPDREHVERRIKNLNDQLERESASVAAPSPAAPSSASAAPAATAAPEPLPASPSATSSAPAGATPETGAHTATPWIVVGIGGAVAIAGVALFAVGAGDISSAASSCGNKHQNCPADVASKGNRGISLEKAGVTTGILGIAALAGGLIWHFAEKPSATGATGAFVKPVVAPGYAGIELAGVFPGGSGSESHRLQQTPSGAK
jgi:tetratricopeptide (TPR) repeat protein